MVSIHIPTYTEPPEVVKGTLDSLNKLDYPNFEVVVVDNNTVEEELWKPVQEYCEQLGPKFKFFHVANLPGAKGGALNFALKKTDPATEIVAVVDSDYQVKSNFLKALVPYFKDPKVALVQTSQDYRGFKSGSYMEKPFWEYRYFFSFVMPSCHEYDAASFMGTMGLIRKRVLTEIKKWSEWCVTEDTELGVRIHQNKLSTIYVDESFGRGLMPFEFRDYKQQRRRWAFGNMQIIRRNLFSLLPIPFVNKLNFRQKISYFSQLTVWFNNLFLSSLLLIGLGILKITGFMIGTPLIAAGGLLLAAFFASRVFMFLWALRRKEKISFGKACGALFSNLSLNWPMAIAWWKCLFNPKGYFWRTSKYPHELKTKERVGTVRWESLFFVASAYLGTLLMVQQDWLLGIILMLQAVIIYLPALIAIVRYK
jgi:cellulose synthase/poly-beta-1,6-N-acetylglucosamine synthase-like glycosyltransferase